jgi:peptidoglycan/xylan/chitin deacetylase (PgdA/CDA1 family)
MNHFCQAKFRRDDYDNGIFSSGPQNRASTLISLPQTLRAVVWRLTHPNFLIIFNWHQITPAFDPLLHHQYTWTRLQDFGAAVDDLSARFRILPLHEAIARINRGDLRGACAVLTFDDGDSSLAEYVVPLLREQNLPATFFINSAYLESQRSYWFPILSYLCSIESANAQAALPDKLRQRAQQLRVTGNAPFYRSVRDRIEELAPLVPNLRTRTVSAEWLTKLDGDQFAIGAHGHEHQRYAMMTPEWQVNDLRENVRILSQFKAYRPIFAVPFGRPWDWTDHTLRIAHKQGLQIVLANGGINVGRCDVYRRIPSDGQQIRRLVTAAMSDAFRERSSP